MIVGRVDSHRDRSFTLPRNLHRLVHPSPSRTRTPSTITELQFDPRNVHDDVKMADLCMTMGCYSAVSKMLNMFEVPLPNGEARPFDEPPTAPPS